MKVVFLGGTGLLGSNIKVLKSEWMYFGSDLDISDFNKLSKKLNEINLI